MAEIIIDLQPKSIESLNEKLIEILKMPEELLRLYTSTPHITEDEQATLEKAAVAYSSKKFIAAVRDYRKCSVSIGKKSDVNFNNNNEKSQLDIVVQYLLSKCLIESGQFTDLLDAQNILIQLEETVGKQYPMIYCALGEFYIKLFCFEDAERMINKGLGILTGGNANLVNCYVPITNEIIVESTNQGLTTQLFKLRKQCMGWHRPDAVCFTTNCRSNSPYNLSGRNIYFNSPAFNGMVMIICDNANSCNIPFHAACWKAQKKILSSGRKMSDKEFLNWECFTPNCGRELTPSRIKIIEIRDEEKGIKFIEMPPEKQDRVRNIPSKGATRKQKKEPKIIEQKIKPKLPFVKKIIPNEPKVRKNPPNGTDQLQSRLLKLHYLREDNFNIDAGNDWRPDAPFYGNSEFTIKYDKMPPEPVPSNDCKQVAGLKSFLYSYFYQFISRNEPVKIDILQEKWEEATNLIANCDTLLYDTGCANVTEFLLQSLKFSVIGDYICTPASLQETYALVKSNICTTFRCLMDNDYDSKLEDKVEDLVKSIIINPEEYTTTSIDNSSCQTEDNNVKNAPCTTPIPENNNLSDIYNNEESSSDYHDILMNEEELFQCASEKIECESEITINGESEDKISIPTSPLTINERPTEILNSLLEQLEISHDELKTKDIQLTDMKMTMLRTNLDSQYMTIRVFINTRLSNCQKDLAIVEKMQNALLKIVGVTLPLDKREWLEPIEALKQVTHTLQHTYDRKLAEINSKERCKEIDDVHLIMPSLPPLPNRDIPELLQIAFDMCYNRLQSSCSMPPPIIPNPYPSPLMPNPPMFISPHYTFIRPQTPPVTPHPPLMPHYPLITNNSQMHPNTMLMPQQSTIINKANDRFKHLNGLQKQQMQQPKVDKIKLDEKTVDSASISADDGDSNTKLKNSKPTEKTKPSMDVLLDLLRSRNGGVLEYDLLWSVNQVRKRHNNSLTGLPLSVVLNEVERQLINREKLQLADYSATIHKEVQHDFVNLRQRKTSVSSTSSQVSANSWSKESVIKKNPWNTINDTSSTRNVDFEQNDCVICFESLEGCSSRIIYRLQCKHTFHTKCIENWLKKNRSCPTCRVHSIMDSDFPPL